MEFGLIAAIVVAVGSAGLWLFTQNKLAATTAANEKTQNELREATRRAETAEQSQKELQHNLGSLQENAKVASARLETVIEDLESVTNDRAKLEEVVAERDDALKLLAGERDALSKQLAEQADSADPVKHVATTTETVAVASVQPSALWDLELARSSRTWRTSVATNPDTDADPFEETANTVKTAIEIEAAALREDVGASVAIEWNAGIVHDAARCHLILRLAQEMMASAARQSVPSRLVVDGEHDITLRVEADTESDEAVISLSPPDISGDMFDVSDDRGLVVTVKALDQQIETVPPAEKPVKSD